KAFGDSAINRATSVNSLLNGIEASCPASCAAANTADLPLIEDSFIGDSSAPKSIPSKETFNIAFPVPIIVLSSLPQEDTRPDNSRNNTPIAFVFLLIIFCNFIFLIEFDLSLNFFTTQLSLHHQRLPPIVRIFYYSPNRGEIS